MKTTNKANTTKSFGGLVQQLSDTCLIQGVEPKSLVGQTLPSDQDVTITHEMAEIATHYLAFVKGASE